jgi:hypothetical protein
VCEPGLKYGYGFGESLSGIEISVRLFRSRRTPSASFFGRIVATPLFVVTSSFRCLSILRYPIPTSAAWLQFPEQNASCFQSKGDIIVVEVFQIV